MARETDRLKPMLQGMHWSVLIANGRLLMTSDTPVVAVSPTGEINTRPMLLPEIYMVQVPVTANGPADHQPISEFRQGDTQSSHTRLRHDGAPPPRHAVARRSGAASETRTAKQAHS
jgi:hypothetical protein